MSGVSVTSNTTFVSDGRTIDIFNITSDCKYGVGESHIGSNGSEWVYCKSTAAVNSGSLCSIASDGTLTPVTGALLTTSSTGIGPRLGFAQTAWTSSQYGFVAVRGAKVLVRIAGAAGAYAVLYTTDTAGCVGVTTASASQVEVFGLSFEASVSASGSTASVATANVSFPILRYPRTP